MTSKTFWELSGSEQYELTLQEGVKVASRENRYFQMELYRLFDFHVEFKTQLSDGELWVGLIDHDILLKPYLDQIKIA